MYSFEDIYVVSGKESLNKMKQLENTIKSFINRNNCRISGDVEFKVFPTMQSKHVFAVEIYLNGDLLFGSFVTTVRELRCQFKKYHILW